MKQRPTESVKKSRREGIGSAQDACAKVTVNGDVLLLQLCRLCKCSRWCAIYLRGL